LAAPGKKKKTLVMEEINSWIRSSLAAKKVGATLRPKKSQEVGRAVGKGNTQKPYA